MKNKLAQSLIAIAAVVAAGSSFAQNAYVGGNVGKSDWKADSINGVPGDNKGTSYKLYGGYAFNPHLALEAGYADLGKLSGPIGSTKGRGPFVDAVGKLPIANDFSAIGRVGVFNGKLSGPNGSDSGTNAKFGAGLQYDLSKTSAIRGEWERYRFNAFNSKTNADQLSIGYVHGF